MYQKMRTALLRIMKRAVAVAEFSLTDRNGAERSGSNDSQKMKNAALTAVHTPPRQFN